ncbi:MAG: LysM peptidoglycan-binding domain-containing protein [Bacteroidota bacterium]
MKIKGLFFFMLAALLVVSVSVSQAQEEMTMEEWQAQVDQLTAARDELSGKLDTLGKDITDMTASSTNLTESHKTCMDELYALVGSNAEEAAAYRAQIEAAENQANMLTRLSDADLLARSGEVDELATTVDGLWENKLSLIPEFWDGLTGLNEKVKSLQDALAAQGKVYTVGTWASDRDCLWNIAKKPDIYDNAWLWPRIWQGNRDQIKDPDLIYPGQKLTIPKGDEMSTEEKGAARTYYKSKPAAEID